MKHHLRAFAFFISLLVSNAAWAVDPVYTGLFSNKAIKGYDTVAYFTEGKPVEGSTEFSFEYKEAIWLFSSQENLDLFKEDPQKYEPQYGGYCAFAVAKGTTASIKPELFTINDGKLYLNYSKKINDQWLDDKENFIKSADKNWPEVLAK